MDDDYRGDVVLRISTKTMSRLIREGVVHTRAHPLDRRKKLVRLAEIERLRKEADALAA